MENRYETRYFEKYAKLSLAYCYDPSWKGFKLGESPDLQNEELGIGIEVTRAISIRSRNSERSLSEKIDRIKSELKKHDPSLFFNVSVTQNIALIKGAYDFKIHLEEIEESIRTKTGKLNKNYRKFTENHLYIFTFDDHLTQDSIQKTVENSDTFIENERVKYDMYFINCIDKIYAVGRNPLKIEVLRLSGSLLERLKTEAV